MGLGSLRTGNRHSMDDSQSDQAMIDLGKPMSCAIRAHQDSKSFVSHSQSCDAHGKSMSSANLRRDRDFWEESSCRRVAVPRRTIGRLMCGGDAGHDGRSG